jgi:soluble lytic murein transglycosylase-like protein
VKGSRLFFFMILTCACFASSRNQARAEAEYYVDVYALHYGLPVEFIRAIVEQESGWRRSAISPKGAIGLMQLMPETARRLGVANPGDVNQNVAGGVRLLAWLAKKFHGDLRLVAAAYYAGARLIDARGLSYANSDVVAYVAAIRARVEVERRFH